MIHKMGLYSEHFQSITEGKKKVEVRLNDEKRRKIMTIPLNLLRFLNRMARS